MDISSVAAEYIRTHRGDCSDAEIRTALKQQGFSDEILADAFHEAGERPRNAPAPKKNRRGLSVLVWALWALSACMAIGAVALLANNLASLEHTKRPLRSAQRAPRDR
ncbi:MAG: hypothetical protein KGJ84_05785 [Elusimicrobia bacterium]|nr:hypothetical protein [Elusimicrobiota bacterium]